MYRRFFISFLVCWLFSLPLKAQETEAFQDSKSKKYGFRYVKDGDILIKPRFDKAEDFDPETDLALIRTKYGYGFIDRTGRKVIAPAYEKARSFAEGSAAVRKGGKWGFIDKKGQLIIACEYDAVADFVEGLTSVCNECLEDQMQGGRHGMINKKGKLVLPLEYDRVSAVQEGFAIASVGGKYFFVKPDGSKLSPAGYQGALPFENGYGRICQDCEAIRYTDEFGEEQTGFIGGKWAYTDKTGALYHTGADGYPVYDYVFPFDKYGSSFVGLDCEFDRKTTLPVGGSYAYVEGRRGLVSGYEFDEVRAFCEGKAPYASYLTQEDSEGISKIYGLLGTANTQLAIPEDLEYASVSNFREGFAVVMTQDSLYGYISDEGRTVVGAYLTKAYPFSEGKALVLTEDIHTQKKKYGWINRETNFVILPQFDEVIGFKGFRNGKARVRKGKNVMTINASGKCLEGCP